MKVRYPIRCNLQGFAHAVQRKRKSKIRSIREESLQVQRGRFVTSKYRGRCLKLFLGMSTWLRVVGRTLVRPTLIQRISSLGGHL